MGAKGPVAAAAAAAVAAVAVAVEAVPPLFALGPPSPPRPPLAPPLAGCFLPQKKPPISSSPFPSSERGAGIAT